MGRESHLVETSTRCIAGSRRMVSSSVVDDINTLVSESFSSVSDYSFFHFKVDN